MLAKVTKPGHGEGVGETCHLKTQPKADMATDSDEGYGSIILNLHQVSSVYQVTSDRTRIGVI